MKKLSKVGTFSLMMAASLTIMVGSAITPALLSISQHFGIREMASWLTTLPALGVVLFAPFAGRLIDKIGAYIVLCIGLVLYGFFGIVAIWLSGIVPVFIDRLLLGAATALVMSSGTALIAEFFQGEQRLKMIALQGMSIEAGGIIFLSIGGMLGSMGWKWPFAIYLLAWLTLFFVLFTVPFNRVTSMSNTEKEKNTGSQNIIPALATALLSMMIFFVAIIMLPLFLAKNFDVSSVGTGYFLAFISAIAVVAASLMPKVTKHLSDYKTLILGFGFYACGHLMLALTYNMFILIILAGIFIGIGFGFTIPLANHMTVEKSSPKNRGRNLAYYSSFTFSGQFLSSFMEGVSNNTHNTFMITGLVSGLIAIFSIVALKHYNKNNSKYLTK